jgi:2-succinyl-5-enolpyruvyl-6-hydroxy-3-cyclohexene-1-carboxylate synthase
MLSKQLTRYLAEEHDAPYMVIDSRPGRQDPAHCVAVRIQCDPIVFAGFLSAQLPENPPTPLLKDLSAISRLIDSFLEKSFVSLSEPAIARTISQLIPRRHILFTGNSMPVRDLDLFAATRPKAPAILGNRGASGIDGNIATAAGIAVGGDATTTLLIGDLAFLHDLGSLIFCFGQISYMQDHGYGLIIVVINNQGGGIFSFLPIAEEKDVFSPFFDTPHPFDFQHVAFQFGLHYDAPNTIEEFVQAYRKALRKRDVSIIEVKTDRSENFQLHQKLNAAIQECIGSAVGWSQEP